MTEKLKPCPFCGGEAEVNTNYWNWDEDDSCFACGFCSSCNAETALFHREQDAIEAWNRRVEK